MPLTRRLYYILDADHQAQPTPSLDVWSTWMAKAEREGLRRVAGTMCSGDVCVSTVFLGLDHSFALRGGAPVLFETMTLGGTHDQVVARYSTWDEALAGHARAVYQVEHQSAAAGALALLPTPAPVE